MKQVFIRRAVTLAAIGSGFMAMPALAVQVTFASNDSAVVGPQTGADTLGNTWETTNGPANNNSSQNNIGFQGFFLRTVASGLVNDFVAKPSTESVTRVTRAPTNFLLDEAYGLYQCIRFTALLGNQLSQDGGFNTKVNFVGRMGLAGASGRKNSLIAKAGVC